MKRIQGYEMRHMQAESRETTYKEKERRDPYMNSGGSAPADMGGEPPDGRAKFTLDGIVCTGGSVVKLAFRIDR